MFQTKVVEEVKTQFVFILFSENRAVYGIMWKNIVQSDRPQTTNKGKQLQKFTEIKDSDLLLLQHTDRQRISESL